VKKTKVQKVLHEYKTGTLHSGKSGKVVKSRKQAVAIALSEAGKAKKKTSKKPMKKGK
jgi:ribosomal protein L21E